MKSKTLEIALDEVMLIPFKINLTDGSGADPRFTVDRKADDVTIWGKSGAIFDDNGHQVRKPREGVPSVEIPTGFAECIRQTIHQNTYAPGVDSDVQGYTIGVFIESVDRKPKASKSAKGKAQSVGGTDEGNTELREFFITEGDKAGLTELFVSMGLPKAAALKSATRAIKNAS